MPGRPASLAFAASILIGSLAAHAASLGGSSLPRNPDGAPAVTDPADTQYLVPTRQDQIGRITAPVKINGQGPFRFMIDTGSNHTVIAAATLTRLGLHSSDEYPVTVTGIGGSEIAPTAHIDSLDAGDMHFIDLELPVLSGRVFGGIDGILGMDAFDGMKVSADFHKGRISILHSRNNRPAPGYYVLNAKFLSDRLLMIDAEVGRIKTKAIIDTGGERTLGNPALLKALTSKRRSPYQPVTTNVFGVTSVVAIGTVDRAPPIQVGAAGISDLYVVYGDFQIFKTWGLEDTPAILIGMDILGSLSALTIDYRRKEVDFLPHENDRPTVDKRWFSMTDF